MTSPLFTAGGTWLPLLLGSIILLVATWKAVQQRKNPCSLIRWGALHDAGIVCMALAADATAGLTGLWLFIIFQLSARLLALKALQRLAPTAGCSIKHVGTADSEALRGIGRVDSWGGALFALGMLAAVGGSPFLVPEGRSFIVQALVQTAPASYGIAALMLMAAATTVFIWLSVDTVRIMVLEKDDQAQATPRHPGWSLVVGLGVLVAILGLFRGPVTDMLGAATGLEVVHASSHGAFWCYYLGALASGLLSLMGISAAPLVGTAFSALALLVVVLASAAPLAKLFLMMIALVALIVCIYSLDYIHERKGTYWFFLLLTFASLAGIVSATDNTALYGYWELMTFASYFLVVHEGRRTAFEAGLKYYVMCAGGALFMLPGLHMLDALAAAPLAAFNLPMLFQLGLILCLAGFAVKAGLVPLHSWLPDAHPAAPSSVSGPLSGIITKMGIFGIVSVIFVALGSSLDDTRGYFGLNWFGTGLTAMGVATLAYGEIMALKQDDIKRMLAYSTLGQIGEIALVLGLATWLSTTGALWHMFNHAIMKDLLFLGAGALILRTGSRDLADLRGLGRQMPWTVGCMAVGLVSIMGLPPFGAFYSKFMMIQAATDAGQIWLAALILAGSLIGAIYYTRILKTLVFEARPDHLPTVQEAPLYIRIALLALAAISLLLGLFPQMLMPLITPVASLCFAPAETVPAILAAVDVAWPIYVIVPVFGALLPAAFYRDRKSAAWTSVGVLLLTALLVLLFGRELDTLSFSFALIVPLLGAVNMTYAAGYMDHSHSQWRFYCAFTCMCGGLIGMAASQYLLSFFLFWEIMSSWSLYMAIAHEGDKYSLREAFKYFFFNLLGAGFIFAGLCVMGPFTPFNISLLTGQVPDITGCTAWLGMALLAIGFVMKAAQLPFRIDWQMHPALAPTPVSGYISSVLLKSALIGLIKLFMLLGGGLVMAGVLSELGQDVISVSVMWIGAITIIMAAVQALRSNGLKLVFIYSTVSQLGYMVLAVAAGGALGYAGGMLHIINHVFFKDLLFLVCGAVMFATHKDSLDDLGGIGRKMPFTLCMFAIAGLSVVGVPPTSGFSSKWLIYHALMEAGQPLLALLSLVGSVLTLAYIAKFLHAAFLGQPGHDLDHVEEAPKVMRVSMGILAAGCILTGIFPGLALAPINAVLAEYGLIPLKTGISGVLAGPGAWNATGMFIMMAVAFWIGYTFVRRFTRLREIDIHTCGLPPEVGTSRMAPSSIYGGLARLFSSAASKENC